jgi:hypothetical protein
MSIPDLAVSNVVGLFSKEFIEEYSRGFSELELFYDFITAKPTYYICLIRQPCFSDALAEVEIPVTV